MLASIDIRNTELLKKIKDQFFQNSPILISETLTGQVVNNGIITLGCMAGQHNASIEYLLHEMCHLVEIEDDRMTQPNWGLKFGSDIQTIFGTRVQNFKTTQATHREMRVWAYQQHLHELFGIEKPLLETVSVAKNMNDFCFIRFSLFQGDEPAALNWVESEVKKMMNTFSLARFSSEWTRKTKILSQVSV